MLPPDAIRSRQLLILDGGLATQIESQGYDISDELWSATCLLTKEGREHIRSAHLTYFRAGADIAITSSYQASFQAFGARGMRGTEAIELMKTTVTIAREAAETVCREFEEVDRPPRRLLVAASVGCYGATLHDGSEYHGQYPAGTTVESLVGFHRCARANARVCACVRVCV